MSIFVDDLTFSGLKVDKLLRKSIENIITNSGLTVHPKKTKFYKRDQPKLITGVILTPTEMKVRHKHHKAIFTKCSELEQCSNDAELEVLQKQFLGRLSAAGQIDRSFKQRAITLRKKFSS